MASYLLQEDGVSKLMLEDGTGFIILDELAVTPNLHRLFIDLETGNLIYKLTPNP